LTADAVEAVDTPDAVDAPDMADAAGRASRRVGEEGVRRAEAEAVSALPGVCRSRGHRCKGRHRERPGE
jgi:hypothetical protein